MTAVSDSVILDLLVGVLASVYFREVCPETKGAHHATKKERAANLPQALLRVRSRHHQWPRYCARWPSTSPKAVRPTQKCSPRFSRLGFKHVQLANGVAVAELLTSNSKKRPCGITDKGDGCGRFWVDWGRRMLLGSRPRTCTLKRVDQACLLPLRRRSPNRHLRRFCLDHSLDQRFR